MTMTHRYLRRLSTWMACRTVRLLDYQTVRLLDYQRVNLSLSPSLPLSLAPSLIALSQRLLLLLVAALCIVCTGEHGDDQAGKGGPATPEDIWVDSVFQKLTPDERLGQLFMIRAHSDKGEDHIAKVEQLLKTYHVGGLCFFQGTPDKQVALINRYQKLAPKVPLIVSIDGEWGLGMRMKATTISFPRQLTLGAIQDDQLIYDMGKEIARQMRAVGVHVNFAPVVDVNNNANNPVIGNRSFGEDPGNVARKGVMYMRGMQEHQVMACAKHFPGHGDTDVDSHFDLPVINHTRARLDSIELYPFRELISQGVGSVMVAHLHVPAFDDRENRPTTLSEPTIAKLLKEEMGYKGLVLTDALEMKGVAKHFESGEVEAEALVAGVDMLLLPGDVGTAIQTIKAYVKDGKLEQEYLDSRVKKILRAKYRLGLTSFTPLATEGLAKKLNSSEAKALKQKLYENALTLVRNKGDLLPFESTAKLKLATLGIGATEKTKFQQRLDDFGKFKHFLATKDVNAEEKAKLIKDLSAYNTVVVSLHDMNMMASKDFGISDSARELIQSLSRETRVILVVFGSPYSLRFFENQDWVLEAYEDDELMHDVAAQALFGAVAARGLLPVTASPKFPYRSGITTKKTFRLGYSLPENVGLSADSLKKIDMLAQYAISDKATPGCVVLVAKSGSIVYQKAFGHHTYERKREVRTDDVYDLASVTKIAATTLAVMKLYDDGVIDLYQPISCYLPELEGSNKANIMLLEILLHRAALPGWIPFYRKTLTKATKKEPAKPIYDNYYCAKEYDEFAVPVARHMYLRNDYSDTIWHQIIKAELLPSKAYKYSDLGFYLLARMVERLTGRPLDQYVQEEFYTPMELSTATFNPWQKLPMEDIVPSEEDRYFRHQRLQGYVHDMGAAMLGGVSGHAGLFSNAKDLAVIMQMLLQKGYYNGQQYLRPETVELFTSRPTGITRRGLGFDMCHPDPERARNFSRKASTDTFGHVGFTGVCAWADPATDMVFVFLANRTYPSMRNYRLNKLGIRKRMQGAVYDAMPNAGLAAIPTAASAKRLATGK